MATTSVHDAGNLSDGRHVERVILDDGHGVSATILTLGATLQSLWVPDGRGHRTDIVLGHDLADEYLAHKHYFGCSVGRSANRIANGRFELDGRLYQLDRNDGNHHLHGGGESAFHRRIWSIEDARDGSVSLSLRSEDGAGGYPGCVQATATFTLGIRGSLEIVYTATTSAPTLVNLTNHSYYNLSGGQRSALDASLQLFASRYVPVDASLIPIGTLSDADGGAFDFSNARLIGACIREPHPQLRHARGYDHHFDIDGVAGVLRPAARLEDSVSGRWLDLQVTAAGLQFYSGNFLDGSIAGKGGQAYRQGDGVCLEPQGHPDAPNHPAFPSTRLDPGETYVNRMVMGFGAP